MIVEPVEVRPVGGGVERAATLRWTGGSARLAVSGPADVIDLTDDASGMVCAALPLALRSGASLEVRGPVDPGLIARLEDLQALYLAWDPRTSPVEIAARPPARSAPAAPAAAGSAAFFSRGVDSMFTAARDRAAAQRLSALVFVDHLEPRHDAQVRAEEIRRAGSAADRLGLPLVVVSTTVHTAFDDAQFDWEDAVGAALAFVAHAVAGGFGRVVIPSGDSYATVEPCGTSPLLDPLFSTGRTEVVHDTLAFSRLDKVGWLAKHRPDLLGDLKVCFKENRPDNCGHCGKCVLTMSCLHVHGALADASQFPDAIDPDDIRRFRLPTLRARVDWAEVAGALGTTDLDRALRAAALDTLRTSALSGPDRRDAAGNPAWSDPYWIRNHRLNATLALAVDGVPYPPLPPADDEPHRREPVAELGPGAPEAGQRVVPARGRFLRALRRR